MSAEPIPLTRRMPGSVRDTLSWLAHLVDASLPLRTAEDEDEFAYRHLGADGDGLVAVREQLGPFTAPVVTRAFAMDMREHPPYEVVGRFSDESPTWERLRLDGETEVVPTGLIAVFAAGTLLPVPAVVSVDAQWSNKEIAVHVRSADAEAGEEYLHDLLVRARGPANYLRGRCLLVESGGNEITVRAMPVPTLRRAHVVLPDDVWAEVDLNVAALFDRRPLLEGLGLGTTRGVLLAGPPGTGKSALCEVLAAELAGIVTVVLCGASAIRSHLMRVYDEVAHLAPALVLMEDLDLVVGRSGDGLHEFLAALDGAMRRNDGVVTVATTNDVSALHGAAVRAARFDSHVAIPLPALAQRREILRRYLGPLAGTVDVAAVAAATEGASGADLRELVRRGVLGAGEELGTADVLGIVRGGAWRPADTGQYL